MARTSKRAEKPNQQEGLTDVRLDLELSEAQRRSILKCADLPAHLAEPLSALGGEGSATQFTLDELDELLDRLEKRSIEPSETRSRKSCASCRRWRACSVARLSLPPFRATGPPRRHPRSFRSKDLEGH